MGLAAKLLTISSTSGKLKSAKFRKKRWLYITFVKKAKKINNQNSHHTKKGGKKKKVESAPTSLNSFLRSRPKKNCSYIKSKNSKLTQNYHGIAMQKIFILFVIFIFFVFSSWRRPPLARLKPLPSSLCLSTKGFSLARLVIILLSRPSFLRLNV